MKRMFTIFCFVVAVSALALAQGAQPAQGGEMTKKSTKKAEQAAPKGDAEVQKCIADKFANSEKLKSQGFNAAVTGGEATLTGAAKNAGSKGAATKIAKSCGAQKVTNNISAPPIPKPAKSGDGKSTEKKG